jgi:uncharacterized membrane protein YfcA
MFESVLLCISVAAGAVASVSGFGIGSLLTPLLALHVGTKTAVAAVLGALLVFAGAAQFTGLAQRWRLKGGLAWAAGAASGLFGGLVGNQGGIRSAAMLGFDLTKEQFVATATAIALCVDAARMPVYLVAEREEVAAIWPLVLLATIGVVVGTLAGERLLARVPERRFRQVIGAIVLLLGIATLIRGRA